MNERRYFAHLAEAAIAAGRPLGDELRDAETRLRFRPKRVDEALAHAKDGDLGLAMERLRLDPLVAAVAHLQPSATVEVSRRLRDLPSPWEVAAPVLFPALYLLALVILQLAGALAIVFRILPSLPDPGLARVVVSIAAAILGLSLLGSAVALLTMQIRTAATGGLRSHLLRHVRAARLFTAVSSAVRHGAAPNAAIDRLAGPARVNEPEISALLGTGALDAAALDTLAQWLAGEGIRRSRQLSVRLRTAGAAALVFTGVLMVGSLYLAISSVAGSVLVAAPW